MSKASEDFSVTSWARSTAGSPSPSDTITRRRQSVGKTSVSGTKNPNYQNQIAQLQDATTPYSRVILRNWSNINHVSESAAIPGGRLFRYEASCQAAPMPVKPTSANSPSITPCENVALSILKRKMQDDYHQFKAALPLAEINETRQLLKQTSGSLAKTLSTMDGYYHRAEKLAGIVPGGKIAKSLAKTYRAAFNDASKRAADHWLGWGFGIAPTLSDIKDLGTSINDFMEKQASFHETYESSFGTDWLKSSKSTTTGVAGTTCDLTYEYVARYNVKFIVGITRRIGNTADYSVADHFGFSSPGEIIPGLWEATAFSWVADYIANMNEFLEDNFSVPAGTTTFVVKNTKSRISCITHAKPRSLNSGSYNVFRIVPGRSRYEYVAFDRYKLSSIPRRALSFRSTDDMLYHWQNKLANILSVIRGRIR